MSDIWFSTITGYCRYHFTDLVFGLSLLPLFYLTELMCVIFVLKSIHAYEANATLYLKTSGMLFAQYVHMGQHCI